MQGSSFTEVTRLQELLAIVKYLSYKVTLFFGNQPSCAHNLKRGRGFYRDRQCSFCLLVLALGSDPSTSSRLRRKGTKDVTTPLYSSLDRPWPRPLPPCASQILVSQSHFLHPRPSSLLPPPAVSTGSPASSAVISSKTRLSFVRHGHQEPRESAEKQPFFLLFT